MDQATFAAGCFWGVQRIFDHLPGVISTTVGYTGGHTINPSYEQVCHGDTGHAEAIHVVFDPQIITYANLLEAFWHMHNPTTLNRQGPDFGAQYRSAIFYHSEEQLAAALASQHDLELSHEYADPVVTQIVPAQQFFPAEEYHQKYYLKHKGDYC